mmetsp:Transcript_33367/g.72927  ORF Transcript_33367/g.72927 Transcript_33367/m.72927 type:complete len:294 (+) Transcript_33367:1204-2085(+)
MLWYRYPEGKLPGLPSRRSSACMLREVEARSSQSVLGVAWTATGSECNKRQRLKQSNAAHGFNPTGQQYPVATRRPLPRQDPTASRRCATRRMPRRTFPEALRSKPVGNGRSGENGLCWRVRSLARARPSSPHAWSCRGGRRRVGGAERLSSRRGSEQRGQRGVRLAATGAASAAELWQAACQEYCAKASRRKRGVLHPMALLVCQELPQASRKRPCGHWLTRDGRPSALQTPCSRQPNPRSTIAFWALQRRGPQTARPFPGLGETFIVIHPAISWAAILQSKGAAARRWPKT